MLFSRFTIEYFRGYKDTQTLEFGMPVSGKPGSGITYIVGENNSGKTTLVEGLFQKQSTLIRSSEISAEGTPIFCLYNDRAEIARKVQLIRPGSYTLVEEPTLPDQATFEIIQARRHWASRVHNSSTFEGLMNEISRHSPRDHSSSQNSVSGALKAIEADQAQYTRFIELVKEVLPEFHSFAIAYEEYEYVEYTTNGGQKHASDFLGDGVISILRILAHLFNNREQPLVIDEPELSLHPLAQKRLYEIISRYAEHRQIIISTHSPYFISWEHIKNGAKLNKVAKHGDGKSEIFSLSDYSTYAQLLNGANWQQPFLMDIVAKEIFFHDSFLFLEGQEDVGLLRNEGSLNGAINLFGYGVRGKDAFKFALKLANDLGIKKAAVILDNGESETQIRQELETEFSRYKIIQWSKDDIRDKQPTTSAAKKGYFTQKGAKKNDNELDDFYDKINEINAYFAS